MISRNVIKYFVIYLLSLSCQTECSRIDFLKFKVDTGTPLLHIVRENSGCRYDLAGEFTVTGILMKCEGTIELKENRFVFSGAIGSIKFNSLLMFDLSHPINKINPIGSPGAEIGKISLDYVFDRSDKKVFQFRILEGLVYEDGTRYDLVFFVTKDNFIIGSYVSRFDGNGEEIVVSKKGDILEDKIDYTKKMIRHLL